MTRSYLIRKIGAPLPPEKMIVYDQDAWDIINRILIKHKKCAEYYDRIADDFSASSVERVAEKLWEFCKSNIAYDEETIERQEVSSPQTILQRGHCDCKGYALFIGGVLDALNRQGWNIKWKYRFASDDKNNDTPGHVFVVIDTAQGEIWIDPVLNYFNQEHYFPFYQDRKVSAAPAAIAGCGCAAIGVTEKQAGQALMKLAPSLAAVPVAALAVEAAGVILNFFGDNFIYSSDVRGLIQKYQYFVQGNAAVKQAAQADQSLKDKAQAWFSLVLGVPIYDDLRYDALRGEDHATFSDLPNRWDYNARVQKYKSFGQVESSQPDAVVLQAAYIADKLDDRTAGAYPTAPGAWAGELPAASVIDNNPNAQPTMYVDQYGNLTTPAGQPIPQKNTLILLAAGAAILFLLLK